MKFLLESIVVLIIVFLTACDKDGGGGTPSSTTITGQVFDAEIANAAVEVFTLDHQLLATSQTDASCRFSVTISGQSAQGLTGNSN